MSNIPSEWFSRPRPLPLDEQGRVDFSKEVEIPNDEPTTRHLISNSVHGKYRVSVDAHNRLGIVQEILLEGGSIVFLASGLSSGEEMSLYDANHNIFRLDKDNNVVWQVKRDDRGRINWDYLMKEVAKGDKGDPEIIRRARKPFTYLSPTFVRMGRFNDSNDIEIPPLLENDESPIWQPGFVIIASAGGEHYELDVETGQAINVSSWRGREW